MVRPAPASPDPGGAARAWTFTFLAAVGILVTFFLAYQQRAPLESARLEVQRSTEAVSSVEAIASRVAEAERSRFAFGQSADPELVKEARASLQQALDERDRLSPHLQSSAAQRQRLELLTGLLHDALDLRLPGEPGSLFPRAQATPEPKVSASPKLPKGRRVPKVKTPPIPVEPPAPTPLPKVRELGDLTRAVLRDLVRDETQSRSLALSTLQVETRATERILGAGLGVCFLLVGASFFTARSGFEGMRRSLRTQVGLAADSLEMLRAVDDGLAVFNPDQGILTGVNDRFLDMTGYPRGQLLTENPPVLLPLDADAPSGDTARLMQKAVRDGASSSLLRIKERTGGERVVRVSFRRIQVGGDLRVLGVFTDVGVMRSELLAAAAERDRLKALFGPAAAPCILLDPVTSRVVEATPAAGALFGCSPETLVEGGLDPLSPGAPPFSREALLSHFERAINQEPQSFEWTSPDTHGRVVDFRVELQRIVLGEADLLLAVLQDTHGERRLHERITTLESELGAAGAREKALQHSSVETAKLVQKLQAEVSSAADQEVKRKEEYQRLRDASKKEKDLFEPLRAAAAGTPGILFALDALGVYRVLEGRGLLKLGLAPGELVGKNASETPRGIPRTPEILKRALAGERFNAREEIGGLWWEIHLAPLEDAQGKAAGCAGSAIEVTERERGARSTQERLENLVGLLDASPEAYLLTDREGLVTFVGGGAFPGLGLDPHETLGKRLEEITPEPGDWKEAIEKSSHLGSAPVAWLSGGESFKGRLMAVKRDDPGGPGFLAVLWPSGREIPDISPENWIGVAEAAPAGLLSLTPEGQVVKLNAEAALLLGRPLAECLGKTLLDLAPEAWWDAWRAILEKARQAPVIDEPLNLARVDGGEIELLASLTPLGQPGRPVGLVLLIRDLAVRTREEQATRNYLARLEQSQKEVLSATTPVVGRLMEDIERIRRHAAGLKDRAGWAINPEGQEHLDHLDSSARNATVRLERWFEYQWVLSRELHCVALDLSLVARETSEGFSELRQKTKATFTIEDLPVVEADPDYLRIMFKHLFDNSLKHARPGVPLEIEVRGQVIRPPEKSQSPGWCQMEIEDNGVGMDEERLEGLFKPIPLGEEITPGGAGMGLLVCRRILERHGGTVSARSEPGKGTTIIVVLPLFQKKA